MPEGMTRVRTFPSQLEGEMARGRLEALGVTAILQSDNCGGQHPEFDPRSGVHLLVADADLEKAREILAEAAAAPSGPPWICLGCGEESEDGFDTCWNCGRPRD